MPPEQARGKRDLIDARTDIWAVGAMMFKALTGRHVHEGDTVNERLLAAMSEKARSITTLLPSLLPAVALVVDRALEFQKTDRWVDANAMQVAARDAFEALEKKPFPTAHRTGTSLFPPPSPASAAALTAAGAEFAVSVVFEPDATNESIVVDFEDPSGNQERYEVRRKPDSTPPGQSAEGEELYDVSIVELLDE
jgi:serine/threonine protein kinase